MIQRSATTGRRFVFPSVERLEERRLLAITWSVTFDDPGKAYTAYYSQIRDTLLAAGADWGRYFPTAKAAIQLSIAFADLPGNTLAEAGSESSVYVQQQGNLQIWEMSVPNEIRTGKDPNGSNPDALITIDSNDLSSILWFDPTPNNRDDEQVPYDEVDAYSVFLHELGHCLGFDGWRDWTTGALPSNYESRFDRYVSIAADGTPYFNGPIAKSVYGNQPIPLTYSNLLHFGNDTYGSDRGAGRPGNDLRYDLMNGLYSDWATRYRVSALDLAVLQDIGLPASFTPVNTPPVMSNIPDEATDEDVVLDVPIVVGDLNSPLDSLAVTITSNNPALLPAGSFSVLGTGANRTLVVQSAANASGSALVTVTVSDGSLSVSDTFNLTVTPVHDAPTLTGSFFVMMDEDHSDSETYAIDSVETAVANLSVSISASNPQLLPPGSLNLVRNGHYLTLSIVPAANQNTGIGLAYVSITVSDGVSETTKTLQLFVRPVNDPPVISVIPDQFILTSSSHDLTFTVDDDETPTNQLSYRATCSNPLLIPLNSLTVYFSGDQLQMTLTPPANQEGTATITVYFGDGQVETSRSFKVRVAANPYPWSNGTLRFDVNGDSFVAPNDALAIINALNASGPGPLAWREANMALPPFFDAYADNYLAANDALEVINYINGHPTQSKSVTIGLGEGESITNRDLLLSTMELDAIVSSVSGTPVSRIRR